MKAIDFQITAEAYLEPTLQKILAKCHIPDTAVVSITCRGLDKIRRTHEFVVIYRESENQKVDIDSACFDIVKAIAENNKLCAIRAVRTLTGLGLLDIKQAFDRHWSLCVDS